MQAGLTDPRLTLREIRRPSFAGYREVMFEQSTVLIDVNERRMSLAT
jgi:hypothetical protein